MNHAGEATSGALRVEELAPGEEPAWDAFVRERPDGAHYHRSAWRDVIFRAFGHFTFLRVARRGSVIEGILPLVRFANPLFGRYLVSMPYLNRGGILASTPEAAHALLDDVRALVKDTRSQYAELRHMAPIDPALPRRAEKVSMSIDLSLGVDGLWDAIGPKVRNLVRKAEKAGLVAREGDPARDFEAFYDLFAENMRDLGTPVYDGRFFREVLQTFADSTRLSIVEQGGVPAAAALCVRHGRFVEIHWAASRRELLAAAPNMLLYWEAISHSARGGLRTFCFGRSTVDSGPYRFKKQWGAVPTPLAWEYLLAPGAAVPGLHPGNPKFRLAVGTWKRMPLGVTRFLGPKIVRHIP